MRSSPAFRQNRSSSLSRARGACLFYRLGNPHRDPVARLLAAVGYAAFRVASMESGMRGRRKLGKALDENFGLLGEVAGHLHG